MNDSVIVYRNPLEKMIWENLAENPEYIAFPFILFFLVWFKMYIATTYLLKPLRKMEKLLRLKDGNSIWIFVIASIFETWLIYKYVL